MSGAWWLDIYDAGLICTGMVWSSTIWDKRASLELKQDKKKGKMRFYTVVAIDFVLFFYLTLF